MFNWFSRPAATNMDAAIERARQTPHAKLIDVREAHEVAQGMVPDALWVPLDFISTLPALIADKNTPLFIYCKSGARASRAILELKTLGYTQLYNAGGILTYHGELIPPASPSTTEE